MNAVYGAIHMHSDFSHDGKDSLETLRTTCVERGISFVGMTDHAEDLDAKVFDTYRCRCSELSGAGFMLIPGLEYRFEGFKGLHLLAFGLREWIEPRTPAEFFEQARGRSRMTMLAHPVLARYQIPDVVLENVDAIEVWNGNYNTRYLPDPKSIRLVQELKRRRPEVVATVGLDQHDSRNDRELRVVLPSASPDPLGEQGGTLRERRAYDAAGFAGLSLARTSGDAQRSARRVRCGRARPGPRPARDQSSPERPTRREGRLGYGLTRARRGTKVELEVPAMEPRRA